MPISPALNELDNVLPHPRLWSLKNRTRRGYFIGVDFDVLYYRGASHLPVDSHLFDELCPGGYRNYACEKDGPATRGEEDPVSRVNIPAFPCTTSSTAKAPCVIWEGRGDQWGGRTFGVPVPIRVHFPQRRRIVASLPRRIIDNLMSLYAQFQDCL